jgi:Glu-tRNA(Gln) amidotransferase subunit E-like FAD-binding protein
MDEMKAGLEIHQQLDTGKLFSRTPSYLRKDEPDYSIVRKLHAVAGESGEVDVAVSHEAGLNREFVYQGYDDTISLVELDESPPRGIDSDALDIALQISLLLNCEIYTNSQIMRKTVIDGSNTSGFQRTVLIGHSGFLDCSFGKVGIESVALEEDAARIVSKDANKSVFKLDRLGIPLVEIGTAPDMRNPEQVKEAALKLGEILRACKVKRGIGTIRQDVNVSSKGHNRVEIKGFQDPKMMVKTIELELARQADEVKKGKKEGEVRNALPSGETKFLRPLPGRARMYPETDLPLLKISRERLNKLKKKLPKLRGEVRDELKKKGVNDEMISLLVNDEMIVDEFSVLMRVYNKDANLVAKMVSLWRGDLSRRSGKSIIEVKEILSEGVLEEILEALKDGKIEKVEVLRVMSEVLKGKKIDEAVKVERVDDDSLEEEIAKIVKSKPGLRPNAYMGLVMSKMKGKIDAKKAMEILKRIIKK